MADATRQCPRKRCGPRRNAETGSGGRVLAARPPRRPPPGSHIRPPAPSRSSRMVGDWRAGAANARTGTGPDLATGDEGGREAAAEGGPPTFRVHEAELAAAPPLPSCRQRWWLTCCAGWRRPARRAGTPAAVGAGHADAEARRKTVMIAGGRSHVGWELYPAPTLVALSAPITTGFRLLQSGDSTGKIRELHRGRASATNSTIPTGKQVIHCILPGPS